MIVHKNYTIVRKNICNFVEMIKNQWYNTHG